MTDLTKGPVGGHVLKFSAFIALTTVFQTLYFLTDLYFVGRLGVSTLLCQVAPDALVGFFNDDPGVVAYGAEYLRIISWNFVATGVIFVSSSMFQGMGNTLPALGSSCLRLLVFAVPAYLLSRHPGFQLKHVWYLSLASVVIQLTINLWLLHREFERKLGFQIAVE